MYTTATNNQGGTAAAKSSAGISLRDGKIDAGRYEISATEDEVWIRDRHTNTWVKLWGDPHGLTSDGDKFQFHENITFDLLDGTKISIKTTPKDANGVAWLDSLCVLKGNQGVEVTGLHDGAAGAKIGSVTNDVAQLEAKYADGTILTINENGQIDDLFTTKGEIVGEDPSARFNEHMVDGLGGKSKYDFSKPTSTGGGSAVSPGSLDSQLSSATSVEEILFLIGLKFMNRVEDLAQKMKGIAKSIDEAKTANPEGSTKELEQQLAALQFEIQRCQQYAQQFMTGATNASKSSHDAKMGIVSNWK